MTIDILATILIVVAVSAMVGLLVYVCCSPDPAPEAPPPRFVTDPALPTIQDRAIARLLRLPHFRRTLGGALFDYYRGAHLETCTCKQLPYPHLQVTYGGKQGALFETAGALEQYVSLQEMVGAMLLAGRSSPASPSPEGN